MTSPPTSKRPRTTDASSSSTDPPYKLHYWPTLPGRGEPIRLCFEATKTPYEDVTNRGAGMSGLKSFISPAPTTNNNPNPPHFAPPVLEHGDLTISQLPNILLYLASKLSLAGPPSDANAIYHINQLALTALDGFLNEAHETHHPISISSFYEDQKPAALARAQDYTSNRLPKFLAYFENVLKSESSGGGEWLYGGQMTYADLVLWQGLDGVSFAFPEKVRGMREGGEYAEVWGLYERVKGLEAVKGYLGSERRLGYGKGIWRYYEELDGGGE
ncbi:MAG: hypothetical protein LQ350_006463 [Teloschistes chrysophthalmus]|nr:MAG: hypothetical protein LQ350_006463 [Niorma chrysophthalma]